MAIIRRRRKKENHDDFAQEEQRREELKDEELRQEEVTQSQNKDNGKENANIQQTQAGKEMDTGTVEDKNSDNTGGAGSRNPAESFTGQIMGTDNGVNGFTAESSSEKKAVVRKTVRRKIRVELIKPDDEIGRASCRERV